MGKQFTRTDTHQHFAALRELKTNFNEQSLAVATKKTYMTGEQQFFQFCELFRVHELGNILPTTEDILCYFATFLAQSVQHGTIKSYLAAVKHLHFQNNLDLPLHKFSRLQYLLRGIKRSQGTSNYVRKPVTTTHLNLFYNLLQPLHHQSSQDSKMLWAAICLAFFGFMRISEFTCDTAFDKKHHLAASDVTFQPSILKPEFIQVHLKSSKTDPFRKGILLTIGATNNHLCPVRAMLNYISASPKNGPLFVYKSGKFLKRDNFTQEIRDLLAKGGFEANSYAGHSFRIGAATMAASANLPTWLIKTMGRWASDCYEKYIRTPERTLAEASAKLIQ